MSTIDGKLQLKGHDATRASIISAHGTYVPEAGEPIRSSDGYITYGNGSTQLSALKYYRFDSVTGNVYFFNSSGGLLLTAYASSSHVEVGGAFIIGSVGQLTVTDGTYNALDVSDTSAIACTGSSGITLNGLTGGTNMQPIFMTINMSAGTFTVNHLSGSGTDELFRLKGGGSWTTTDNGLLILTHRDSRWFVANY